MIRPAAIGFAALCSIAALTNLVATLATTAPDPPLNRDARFAKVAAQHQSGSGTETGIFLPPFAAPGSEITGTVISDSGAGRSRFFLGILSGHQIQYWSGQTGNDGRFHLRLPAIGGATAVVVFKHFNPRGEPDSGGRMQIASSGVHLPNARTMQLAPLTGPALLEAPTAYERDGGSNGVIALHTRAIDPLRAKVLLDGTATHVETLAASSESIVARLAADTPLGRHVVDVQTGNQRTNAQTADVVTLHFDPIGPLHTGQVARVRLHIDGLGNDPASVVFVAAGEAAGSCTERVAVRGGEADCNVRGEHAGQLLVRALLDVELPREIAELAEKTPPPEIGAAPTCSPSITDGWMEPVQGVWQDDPKFTDHPTKQITRLTPLDEPPQYDAELDMISYRDTLLFGVERYEYKGTPVQAGLHQIILMKGMTDCSGPPVPVKMQFRFLRGDYRKRIIWTSEVVTTIRLSGHHVTPVPWQAALNHHADGVPPPDVGPFRIAAFGSYEIQDQLVKLDNSPTGLAMTVQGNVHGTHSIKIAYIPVMLTALGAKDKTELDNDSEILGTEAGKYVPDFYPLSPHSIEGWAYDVVDLSGTNILNPQIPLSMKDSAIYIQSRRADRVKAELIRRFDVLARESKFQRIVAMFTPHDMDLITPGANGYAVAQKVVAAREGRNYFTVAHEVAHTLPYVWSDLEMIRDCTEPGDYHNIGGEWANGFRIDTNNAPGPRQDRDKTLSFMTYTGLPDQTWIDQCTYWNLAKTLRKRPDPAVTLVRGLAFERGQRAGGLLWPMYDETGEVDLVSRAPSPAEHWSFIVRDSAGKTLGAFPFEPQWRDENGNRATVVAFAFQLPKLRGATSLELRGPYGFTRRESLSATPPALEIESPTSGTSVSERNGHIHVVWRAHAAKPLLATVLYSPDGTAWYPAIFEAPVSQTDVAIKSRGKLQRVKVIVTDGTRSSEAVTMFTVRRSL